MTKFYNACTPVEGSDGKTRFPRIGVAFPGKDDGSSIMTVKVDAFPVNGEIVIFEPRSGEENTDTDGS